MSADQYTRERPFHHLSEGRLWITTTVEDRNRIVQEIVHKLDGMSRSIIRNVVNLQDEGLRMALIELGWTPPHNPSCPDLHADPPSHSDNGHMHGPSCK